jgi:hypothetical protein
VQVVLLVGVEAGTWSCWASVYVRRGLADLDLAMSGMLGGSIGG